MPFALSLRQTAAFISKQQGRNEASAEALYQQLRVLSRHDLFKPTTDDVTRGQTAKYDLLNLCALRICLVFFDLGFSPANLGKVKAHLFATRFDPSSAGVTRGATALEEAIEGIENDEEWTFKLTLRRQPESGEQVFSNGFARITDTPNPKVNEILDDYAGGEATVVLPLTELLKPLIRRAAED